ncbi:MAG: hypothetical protein LBL94_05320 [Prevotellaceae bacterium]|nr:hypothetical protein [Prevotellaceae bacterium]
MSLFSLSDIDLGEGGGRKYAAQADSSPAFCFTAESGAALGQALGALDKNGSAAAYADYRKLAYSRDLAAKKDEGKAPRTGSR